MHVFGQQPVSCCFFIMCTIHYVLNIQQHFLVLLRLHIILFNGIEYFFKSLPESAVADNCNQHIYARPFSFGNNRLNQGKYLNLYDCFSTHACLLRLKKSQG